MNIPMFFEKRKNRRRKLTGLLPGKLCLSGSEDSIACSPVDVSKAGIGIVTNLVVKPGTSIDLHTKHGIIKLEVIWGQPDFGKNDLYRYGIETVDKEHDLEQIFAAAGCLV